MPIASQDKENASAGKPPLNKKQGLLTEREKILSQKLKPLIEPNRNQRVVSKERMVGKQEMPKSRIQKDTS